MKKFDVLIYGATPAGIAAAVAAAREGAEVALVQENGHLGGLTSGGLSHTDFRSYESLGGIWREFMDRVEDYYQREHGADSPQAAACLRGAYYEPRVARRIFTEMLEECSSLKVVLPAPLQRTQVEDGRLRWAVFHDPAATGPLEMAADVFIDATYEGDLLAAAGAPYRLGCEARAEYGESLAPETANPFIQATNFRVCLTRNPPNRLPLPKPANYRREDYRQVLDQLAAGELRPLEMGGAGWPLDSLVRARPVPNGKADFNDRMGSPFSIKLIEETHAWPEADAAGRAALFELARNRALGLFWFLANDPDLPEWIHSAMREWGLPRDEYSDTNHWSPALYIREGRRLEGVRTFIQRDAESAGGPRARWQADGVAIGDYGLNSHGTHHLPDGKIGGVTSHPIPPMQVPYACMVPRTLDGLLVPVAISASHVGYSAIRMEPVWTALGEAAGVAAVLATRQKREVRDLEVAEMQARLHQAGAKTLYISDVEADSPFFQAAQWFGTRHGLLHALPGEIHPRPQTRFSDKAQWITAFPHHALEPHRPLDAKLRQTWREKLPPAIRELARREIPETISRGEFLLALFDLQRRAAGREIRDARQAAAK